MNTTRTPDEIYADLVTMDCSDEQRTKLKTQIAGDLTVVLGRAIYIMETDGDELDCEFAESVLRLFKRVSEMEELK